MTILPRDSLADTCRRHQIAEKSNQVFGRMGKPQGVIISPDGDRASKWKFWKSRGRSRQSRQGSIPRPCPPTTRQSSFPDKHPLRLRWDHRSSSTDAGVSPPSLVTTKTSLCEMLIASPPPPLVEPIKAVRRPSRRCPIAPGPRRGEESPPSKRHESVDPRTCWGCETCHESDEALKEADCCRPESDDLWRPVQPDTHLESPCPGGYSSSLQGAFARRRFAEKPRYFNTKPTLEDFRLVRTIGTGSFGRVFMARIKDRPEIPPVAVKRLAKATVVKQKQVEHVLSEKHIFSQVNHPFMVQMHTTFQDQRHLYIVMEYIEGGEFFTFLRQSKRLEDEAAKFYAAHVTLIFEYLHPMNILYRDLKPENLLITRTGYLKLTDFGFAKIVENRTFTLCGTPEYIAPEILLNKGHGKSVDWWTLGILIYEMLVGYPPFFDDEALGIYQKILAGRIVFPRFLHRDAKSLVKRLLTHDLARRYGRVIEGLSDVRGHRWFEGLEFEDLLEQKLKPPYEPICTGLDDTSNFSNYDKQDSLSGSPDSTSLGVQTDAFRDW